MIYNTAYDTTICHGMNMGKVIDAVRYAAKDYSFRSVDSTLVINSSRGSGSAIPAFNHPLYIGDRDPSQLHALANWNDRDYLAVDVRAAGTFDEDKREFIVKNSTLYKTKLYRAALTNTWLTQGPGAIRNLTPMATGVFASWISESIARKYGLDPRTQLDLMIMAGIFYTSNHAEGLEFDKLSENRYLSSIATSLKVSVKDVISIYDTTKMINSIGDFCSKVKSTLGNVRLEDLNSGVLVSIMGSTWYMDNAVESVAVAMEHPPTWLAILLEAHTNVIMKKAAITKICERRQYEDGLELLVRAIKAFAPATTELVAKYK